MARQPEVFVRSLEPEEAQRLGKITRSARDRVRSRRAGIGHRVVAGEHHHPQRAPALLDAAFLATIWACLSHAPRMRLAPKLAPNGLFEHCRCGIYAGQSGAGGARTHGQRIMSPLL